MPIIGILREQEAVAKTAEICRKVGSARRRLKQLVDENAKLPKVAADLGLDKEMLQDRPDWGFLS